LETIRVEKGHFEQAHIKAIRVATSIPNAIELEVIRFSLLTLSHKAKIYILVADNAEELKSWMTTIKSILS